MLFGCLVRTIFFLRLQSAFRQTNIEGIQWLQILFIGEGPGMQEDQQGLPFVGKRTTAQSNAFKSAHQRIYLYYQSSEMPTPQSEKKKKKYMFGNTKTNRIDST